MLGGDEHIVAPPSYGALSKSWRPCHNPENRSPEEMAVSHPLKTCKHGEMIEARENWWREVDFAIMRSNRFMHGTLFSLIRKMRESPGVR